MNELKLTWDGSDLGDITDKVVKLEEQSNEDLGLKVYLEFNNEIVLCWGHKFSNMIPIVVDELKPLFGIQKIGRHTCIIDKTRLLLSRKSGEEKLLEHDVDKLTAFQVNEVRKVYMFRYFVGLTLNNDTSLIVRTYKSGVKSVTSFKDVTINFQSSSSNLSSVALKKWFTDDDDIHTVAKKMIGDMKIVSKKFEVEEIITRLDKTLIWITSGIVDRIQDKISISL